MAKLKLTLIFLLIPAMAYAHGEEALLPIFIQLISLILFIAFIASVKIKHPGKLILTVVYIASTVGVFTLMGSVRYLVYLQKMASINTAIALIPPSAVMLVFFILDKRYSKPRS
jgi:hypothetical protein